MNVIIYEVYGLRQKPRDNAVWTRSNILIYMRNYRNGNMTTKKKTEETHLSLYTPINHNYPQGHFFKTKEALKIIGATKEDIEQSDYLDAIKLEEMVYRLRRETIRNYHPDSHPQYAEWFKEKTAAIESLKHLVPKHRSLEERTYEDAMNYT